MKTKEKPPTGKPDNVDDLINRMAGAVAVGAASEEKLPASNVEMAFKVADTLFDMGTRAKKKMLGILQPNQVDAIKRLDLINNIMFEGRNSLLTKIIDNEIYFSVAEKGKGREQLVQLTKVEDPTEQNVGRIKRYLG